MTHDNTTGIPGLERSHNEVGENHGGLFGEFYTFAGDSGNTWLVSECKRRGGFWLVPNYPTSLPDGPVPGPFETLEEAVAMMSALNQMRLTPEDYASTLKGETDEHASNTAVPPTPAGQDPGR